MLGDMKSYGKDLTASGHVSDIGRAATEETLVGRAPSLDALIDRERHLDRARRCSTCGGSAPVRVMNMS
jgi:hypothetical protein